MRLDEATYTVFDFETTGLFPYSGDKICEIGAVRIEPGSPMKMFHTLVDPERPVSFGAFRVNGITREMLNGKPVIDQVMPSFMEFMKGSVLVAYNAGFDMGFLESALREKSGELRAFRVIDALRLARAVFPGIGRYNLEKVAVSLGINVSGQHRALVDALVTAKVFRKEIEELMAKGVTALDEVAEEPDIKDFRKVEREDDLLGAINSAIAGKSALAITYRSYWDNRTSERRISPVEIKKGFDRSYVIAFCHVRKEVRNFRLDCIMSAEPA